MDRHQKFELITAIDGSNSQLLRAPSGDGFIALKGTPDGKIKRIFQFKCMITGCEWIEKSQTLKEFHILPVSMFIPDSLTNCRQKTQEELVEEAMIRDQIKDLHSVFLELLREYEELDTNPNLNRDRLDAIKDATREIRVKLEELSKFGINVEIPYYLQ